MNEENLVEKLDAIIELLAIDKGEELDKFWRNLDEIQKSVLRETDNWTPASKFKEEIANEAGVSKRTVLRRARKLEEEGLIESHGSTSDVEYKRSPLISHVRRLRNRVEEDV